MKEKFEEKVVKVCGENLYNQSGIGREEDREGRRSISTGIYVVMWGMR